MTKSGYAGAALGLVVMAALAVPVLAHGDRPERPDFSALDADGDGLVTQAELAGHRAARFTALDADGDGALDAAELAARSEADRSDRIARMIARFDTDGDGKLTLVELPARGKGRMLERLDSNSDGVLDAQEYAAAERHKGGKRGGHGGDRMPRE